MTREEYEARRRRLDEEMRAAMELVKAGHQAQVQALDLLWKMSTDGAAAPGPVPTAPPAKPRRRASGELRDEVIAVLLRLPDLLTKDDVQQAFAEPPDRASLFRALQELEMAGLLKVERYGRGRYPTVYRQARPGAMEPGDAAEAT